MKERLQRIDKVIVAGPFRDNWESLSRFTIPSWFREAKFGIFVHWGVFTVPEHANEWYPRSMYTEGLPEFEYHVKTYGPQSEFGYKDFIPLFTAEKFDPEEWAELFAASGGALVFPGSRQEFRKRYQGAAGARRSVLAVDAGGRVHRRAK